MREVSQVFEQGFAVGLRPSLNLGPAVQLLMASMNLVPTSTGLEPREDVTNPIVDISESTYPLSGSVRSYSLCLAIYQERPISC